jgi:hypothetical protein
VSYFPHCASLSLSLNLRCLVEPLRSRTDDVFLTESETIHFNEDQETGRLDPVSEDPILSPNNKDESASQSQEDQSLNQNLNLSFTHQLRQTLNYDRIYTSSDVEWGAVGTSGKLTSTWYCTVSFPVCLCPCLPLSLSASFPVCLPLSLSASLPLCLSPSLPLSLYLS